jgi:protein SCO1
LSADRVSDRDNYAAAFGPNVIGLRGDADQLAALAKRYRVAYSVTPTTDDTPYTVNHSSAIYVFDETGRVRLLISSVATANSDIDGTAADISRLVNQQSPPSFWQRLLQLV